MSVATKQWKDENLATHYQNATLPLNRNGMDYNVLIQPIGQNFGKTQHSELL